MMRSLLLSSLCVLASTLNAQTTRATGHEIGTTTPVRPGSAFHGTVNILLANGNGAVLVTDSRLSNQGIPQGEAPKLFQLDDHTLCSVANFYSFPGPSMNKWTFPANLSIGNVLSVIQRHRLESDSLPLEKKIDSLGRTIAVTLDLVWQLSQREKLDIPPQQSELLFASYEQGHLRIARLVITSIASGNQVRFLAAAPEITEVSGPLAYVVDGIDYIAEPILSGIDPSVKTDPVLKLYKQSLTIDRGADLSLSDMDAIARDLEKRTSAAHPNEVGGAVEVARIESGKARLIDPYPLGQPQTNLLPGGSFASVSGINTVGNVINFVNVGAAFLFDDHFSNATRRLDHTVTFGSSFERCVLHLDDPTTFYFDPSNTVTESVLVLGENADPKSPEVQSLLKQSTGLTLAPRANGTHPW